MPDAVRAPAALTAGITGMALALVCPAAVAAGMAMPASAADTLTALVVSSGPLGFSSAPAVATLGLVDPGSAASITLHGITVSDSRAGTSGWSASVTLTNITGDATGAALSTAGATYTPTVATTTGTVAVTAATASDPTTPGIVQSATGVSGNNSATWDLLLTVPVPNDAVVDTYTATLTFSVS